MLSTSMRLADLDYHLPDGLIAQTPLDQRDASRMMVVDRKAASISDHAFTEFPQFLSAGDVLVLNNTRVFPARLFGRTDTGAAVEIFLIEELDDAVWLALARPGRRLKVGKRIRLTPDASCVVTERREDGKVQIRFELSGGSLEGLLSEVGVTPLPPYIKRPQAALDNVDRDRYQTVFAKERGAIAAPTAGLHFTENVLGHLRARGVQIAELTLHVGYGTFEPVKVDDLSQHSVSPEHYAISDETAARLRSARAEGRRLVAVGTTTTRALESAVAEHGQFVAGHHLARLTITPGYRFRAVNALLTNFHLPQSSLLALTSTFGGHELIMRAYRHAVEAEYRFYSYGDCMLVV